MGVKRRAGVANDIDPADHLQLVAYWARRMGARGRVRDSVQYADGCLGLLRASELFDPTLGYAFSTYASYWIRQSIRRPNEVRVRLKRGGDGKNQWGQLPKLFSQVRLRDRDETSSWDPAVERRPGPLASAARREEHADDTALCEDLLRILNERDRRLVRRHVMEGWTLTDCGQAENPPISRERVRQIVARSLAKINRYVDRVPTTRRETA